MVGKDIRKLSQNKNGKAKGKAGKKDKHRGRPRYKACDPFSGRTYKTDDPDMVNLEPDKSELDFVSDDGNEEMTSYKSYKDKPKYRRDIVFADELNDMKRVKQQEKANRQKQELDNLYVRRDGESMGDYYRRMKREQKLILTEEIKKTQKGSEHQKRYNERRKEEKEMKKKEKEEKKKEREAQMRATTKVSTGIPEQAERPPQLDKIISKMLQNNKMFAREEAKLKAAPKIDKAAALRLCKQNMDRFD